jgi:hypothetical protein
VQERFRAAIARRFGPQLDRLGWDAAADEDDPTRLRRAALVRLDRRRRGWPAVLAEARRRLDAYLADRRLARSEPRRPGRRPRARAIGRRGALRALRAWSPAADTPQERPRFLLSLAASASRRS